MLSSLEKHKLDLRNPKIKKKNLWFQIKTEMLNSGYQHIDETTIERKYRNMKATFKTIKDNKKKSVTGRGQVKWEYFDEMDKIFENDRTINGGHLISSLDPNLDSQNIEITKEDNTEQSSIALVSEDVISVPPTLPSLLSPNLLSNDQKTPKSTDKKIKTERGKQLYGLRKKQLEIEESRVKELQLLREAIEQSNTIQMERNSLLQRYLEKKL